MMKLAFSFFFLSLSALASNMQIKDYNWTVTDVTKEGLTKETLFKSMDRNFVKTGSSICSNRALMWANDFKKQFGIDTAKVFLFYTKKEKSKLSEKTWWYHVTPLVNENGTLWTVDAGFPKFVTSPMSIRDWIYKFTNSYNCKEISLKETDLFELMFVGRPFPNDTQYGHYDCYYKIVPHTFWTPKNVAMNALGRDEEGNPLHFERHEIDTDELYQACLEATTSRMDYVLGTNKDACKAYTGMYD